MSSHHAYTGFWYDKSHSPVLGATITLPIRWANYVVSALTVAVTISASCLWIIGAFVLHQSIVRGQKVDVVGLQHQVILRNSSSPLGSLWELIKVQLAWKQPTAPGIRRRTLALATPALLIWVLFSIASIFVSEVASKSYTQIQVLLAPQNCGILGSSNVFPDPSSLDNSTVQDLNATTLDSMGVYTSKLLKDAIDARAYAANWYSNTSTSLATSSLFPVNSLPYSTTVNASCPFEPSRCLLGVSSGFSMETSLLDSHSTFGINALRSDRVRYQKNVTCAVLHVGDLVEKVSDTILQFHLGPNSGLNYTHRYNAVIAGESLAYMLTPYSSYAGIFNSWDPIPELNRTDADVSTYFLSQNALFYFEPVYDPFFLANGTVKRFQFSRPNVLVSVMGCAGQHRICNPTTQSCTPFRGIKQLLDPVRHIGLNNAQLASASRLVQAADMSGFQQSVFGLGSGALLAKDILLELVSPGLPPNQWQLEATRWFETSLAMMQSIIVQFAANGANLVQLGFITAPENIPDNPPGVRATFVSQCKNQRIQSSREEQSFSFLGLMIVVLTTALLIIVALSLEKCVALARRRSTSHKKTSRQSDLNLHLLRIALASRSEAGADWLLGDVDVPITKQSMEFDRPVMHEDGLASYGEPESKESEGEQKEEEDTP